MTDYISSEKDKYIKLSQALKVLDSCSCWWAHDRMEAIPAAEVRPVVRGRWRERRFSEDVYGAECSVCHTTWDYGTNFCPNCGSQMEG